MLVAGPSAKHPDANYRIEFMRLAATGLTRPGYFAFAGVV